MGRKVHFKHEIDVWDNSLQDYKPVEVSVTCNIYPAEPDVGIKFPYAEIYEITDKDKNDMWSYLDDKDREEIEEQAMKL